MQNSSQSTAYNLYNPIQPLEPVPHWSWNQRPRPSNKGLMEIGGLLGNSTSRYAVNADHDSRRQMQHGLSMDSHFAAGYSISGHQNPYHMSPMSSMAYSHLSQAQQSHAMQSNISPISSCSQPDLEVHSPKMKTEPTAKNFLCSTCPKKFARRSDLARHERIHSGHRPHKCEFPDCGKGFIQRSALTVHARTHTGEKPHKCFVCNKRFADSSSLARHRRTHSGKRPYKCPHATCQKTFTRRTTMTRHQTSHAGSLEEATSDQSLKDSDLRNNHSNEDGYSDADAQSSRTSVTPPAEDEDQTSPTDCAPSVTVPQPSRDVAYFPQVHSLPAHMRNDYGYHMNQSMSIPASYAPLPRSQPTSHLSDYLSVQPLEPPTRMTGSNGTPPHSSTMQWPTSLDGNLPSPSQLDFGAYPDPAYGGQSMFFPGGGMRRPQSTEPEDWSLRTMRQPINTFNNMSLPDWSSITMPEVKQERTYAM